MRRACSGIAGQRESGSDAVLGGGDERIRLHVHCYVESIKAHLLQLTPVASSSTTSHIETLLYLRLHATIVSC